MSDRARRLAAAALAACVSLPLFPATGLAAADTCLTAPKGPGPKGSRWYYRIEWPAQRKCWHLVLNDKRQKTAVKAAPQAEADTDDDTETTLAPAANVAPASNVAPAANVPPARVAEPQPATPTLAPAPVAPRVQTLITRNVSNTDETPSLPDAAAPPAAEQAPATVSEPAPAVIAAPPVSQPVAPTQTANASGADSPVTWRLLFAAIALLGFAAAAALIVAEAMRRRRDVLNTASRADVAPEDWREAQPAEDPPTFAPLPPMGVARDDDVEEAVRRFVQNSRRRAA